MHPWRRFIKKNEVEKIIERKPCKFETLDKFCAMYYLPLPCLFQLSKFDDFVCNNYTPIEKEKTFGYIVQKPKKKGATKWKM